MNKNHIRGREDNATDLKNARKQLLEDMHQNTTIALLQECKKCLAQIMKEAQEQNKSLLEEPHKTYIERILTAIQKLTSVQKLQ